MDSKNGELGFQFRRKTVPVKHPDCISPETAQLAIDSQVFQEWVRRCEVKKRNQQLEIHSVEIQSVDMFGSRVGFVKIKADCTLVDGKTHHEKRLPGICLLRGGAVAILVALVCEDDGKVYSLLVDQPRIPTGQVSCLELPAGMIDDANDGVAGTAAKEMEEECGIKIRPSEMIDMTYLAFSSEVAACNLPCAGIAPSPGGCDEYIRYMYFEKKVSTSDLDKMKGRLAGLRDEGEFITLQVVPIDTMWQISADSKVICAMFLADRLRQQGRMPAIGAFRAALPDPFLTVPNHDNDGYGGIKLPMLAFGLYKVPGTEEGEAIIANAIAAGYRHFDSASLYDNEAALGRAIKKSGVPRKEFIISTKVWNDAQKEGRSAVRASVEKSMQNLDCGTIDILYIHWPVPGCFIETYKELQDLVHEGKVRYIGLSNFGIPEYEELMKCDKIVNMPIINQMEVSPFVYRPETIKFFQDRDIAVAASKALHRATGIDEGVVKSISERHQVTPAQVMLRWGFQKHLIVVAKTSCAERMIENRDIMNFSLTDEEMLELDSLTDENTIKEREELEMQRRHGV